MSIGPIGAINARHRRVVNDGTDTFLTQELETQYTAAAG
jgi:hypothetical protein